ncbi:MAG: HNH endonuclease [Candidatus Odinarchaeota archaeon]
MKFAEESVVKIMEKKKLSRRPPAEVRKILREEVGFGCPVKNCGCPYLEYHHFDPPWHEKQHHDPKGMIALCVTHHKMADSFTFGNKQLRHFKQNPYRNTVRGRFEWLRNDLLIVFAGSIYTNPKYILSIIQNDQKKRIIWITRDDDNNMLLNVSMITRSSEDRAVIIKNNWLKRGNPKNVVCSPSGKKLHIEYTNGDLLGIEFIVLRNKEKFTRRYQTKSALEKISYPITAVEIRYKIGDTNISLTPNHGKINRTSIKNCKFTGEDGITILFDEQNDKKPTDN